MDLRSVTRRNLWIQFCLYLLVVFFQTCLAQAQLQVSGFPETSIKGAVIEAKCSYSSVVSLKWYRNGVLKDDSSVFSGTAVVNTYTFTVKPEDQGATYTCNTTDNNHSVSKSLTMVSETPSNPVIQDNVPFDLLEGTQYTWTCKTTGGYPEPTLTWLLNGSHVTPTSTHSTNVSRTFNVTITLTLTPSSSDNKKVLTCAMVHPFTFDGNRTDTVTMNVLYEPGTPTIEGFPDKSSASGKTESVTCKTKGGNPYPSIAWYKNGSLYDTGTETSSEIDDNIRVTISRLTFVVQPSDRGVLYNCTVWNTQGSLSTTRSMTDVYIPPQTPSLTNPDILYADTEAQWNCTVDDVYPLPNINFTLDGVVLGAAKRGITTTKYGYRVVVTLTYTPSSGDDKKTLFCVIGHPQTLGSDTLSLSTNLVVHSKPSVSVTQSVAKIKIEADVTFECEVFSTLNANVSWYKRTGNTESAITSTIDKIIMAQNNLTIKDLQISDEGTYFCKARSDAGQSDDSSGVKLSVFTLPVNTIISPPSLNLTEGGVISANCSTTVNPPGSVEYRWMFHNGSSPTLISTDSKLNQENVKRSKSGTYTCIVGNFIGNDSKNFSVNVQYRPESSITTGEFSGASGSKVTLTCETTGNPPAFAYQWTVGGSNVASNGNGKSYEADVASGTTIYSCYATNSIGTSAAITFTVIGLQEGNSNADEGQSVSEEVGLSGTAIAAIVLTGVLVLLTIAVVAYCCWRRDEQKGRRKSKIGPRPWKKEDLEDKEDILPNGRFSPDFYGRSSIKKPPMSDVPSSHRSPRDIRSFSTDLANRHPIKPPRRLSPLDEIPHREGKLKKKKPSKRKQKHGIQKKWKREAAEGQESPPQIIETQEKEDEDDDYKAIIDSNEALHTLPDGTRVMLHHQNEAQYDIKEL